MKIDTENHLISFRQSWLDSATICPERGRLGIVAPEWDQLDGDEALIGTSMHEGVQALLEGRTDDVGQYAYDWAIANIEHDNVRWNKRTSVKQLAEVARLCGREWQANVLKHIPLGGLCEVKFHGPVGTIKIDGVEWTLEIEGMVDYVLPGWIVDWKTSGRDYKPWEKQRWAIQPTIYGMAAVNGFLPIEMDWPVRFTYGVVYKPRSKNGSCDSDLITVQRTAADAVWALRKMETYAVLGVEALDVSWPRIDSENNLCSSAYCSWWSMCKGAHISEENYIVPSQSVHLAPTRS